jgi:prolyl oligopeptidase
MSALAQDDPYLWLEEVSGDKALAWVREQNATTQPAIESSPDFKALHERFLGIYNSRDRIPTVKKRGRWLYNFWQDERNPRGVLRRATLDEYRRKEPEWETVLDLGALSAEEKEKWVYKGMTCLYPEYRRCVVSLSRSGAARGYRFQGRSRRRSWRWSVVSR